MVDLVQQSTAASNSAHHIRRDRLDLTLFLVSIGLGFTSAAIVMALILSIANDSMLNHTEFSNMTNSNPATVSTTNHAEFSNVTNSTPVTVSTTQEVQWQTAFWSLVSLAVLTMSQPCGKICSQPSRYRTYLRSSPVVCAADTLSIFTRWAVMSISLRVSPIRALRLLQLERFEDADEAEGLQKLGSSTFGCWIFAVLGPLPVMIKLASFGGTPWTQAFGMSFMVSFVVTEFIIVTAPQGQRVNDLGGGTLHTHMQDRWPG
jgi:hypothetical protein